MTRGCFDEPLTEWINVPAIHKKSTHLLILGGGISGMAAAAEAEKRGIDYILLEKSPQLGGLTRSIFVGDYIFDYTGHFLHLGRHVSPGEISKDFDDSAWRQITKNSKCYFKGTIIDAPFQYHIDQLPERLKARLITSYLARNGENQGVSTFSEYLIANFGRSIASDFLIPYNEKILATDLMRISKDAVTRFFPPPVEKLILQKDDADKSKSSELYNSKFWYPASTGIQLLVDSLRRSLTPKFTSLNTPFKDVDIRNKVVTTKDNQQIRYNELISSIPLNALIKNSSLNDDFGKSLQSDITAATVLSFHLGIKGPIPKEYRDVHWIYFSEKKFPFYRVGFYSNFSEYMCPEDSYSIYVEVGVESPDCDVNSIQGKVINSLHKLMIIDKNRIAVLVSNFMKDGYVHYTATREAVVSKLSKELEDHHVTLVGRYGKWQYSSMEDSIIEGREAVRRLGAS